MKSKATAILIAAIIVLAAADYAVGTDYLKQSRDNEVLSDNITQAEAALSQTPQPAADLAERQTQAEAALAAALDEFPEAVNSTQVVNAVLKLAEACRVSAVPLTTSAWEKDNSGHGYSVLRLTVSAQGSFADLTDFVSRLENGEFPTLIVENLSFKSEPVPFTATINLAVYTQPSP